MTDDQVFAVVLVILLALLGILIILWLTRTSSEKKKSARPGGAGGPVPTAPPRKAESKREEKPVLMGSLLRDEGKPDSHHRTVTAVRRTEPRENTSIDKGYADKHGMWVCGFCEVLNDDALSICQACGQPRSH